MTEKIEVCAVCGEPAEGPCRHLLTGKVVSGGYLHKIGNKRRTKWVEVEDETEPMQPPRHWQDY